MNANIAHALATSAHGRAALRTKRQVHLPQTLDTPPHTRSVVFNHLFKRGETIERDTVASSVTEWIEFLRKTGHSELNIYQLPSSHLLTDWQTAGFVGGGGKWLLGALSPAGTDYWEPNWIFEESGQGGSGIWTVEYARVIRLDQGKPPATISLSDSESALKETVSAAVKFTSGKNLPQYETIFRTCLELLSGGQPIPPTAIVGAPMTERARRVAGAAEHAWVFGGMGSWNDQSFDGADQDSYIKISNELYLSVTHSLVSAVNSAGNRKWFEVWRR